MVQFSPYIYSWGRHNNAYYIDSLDKAWKAGIHSVILAFATNETWSEIEQWRQDIATYPGRVILSIGGADGNYPNESHDVEYGRIKRMLDCGIRGIDFDIENKSMIKNVARIAAIARMVKNKHPEISIYLTLSVSLDGLDFNGLQIVRAFEDHGVHADIVNLMTMDFYTPINTTWGKQSVKILKKAKAQLQNKYDLGVCPMIGFNDDGSFFTTQDMKHVADYAKDNLALISFWALNRDQEGKGDLNLYSGGKLLEYTNVILTSIGKFHH